MSESRNEPAAYDSAASLLTQGKTDEGLRLAVSLLASDPAQPSLLALVARELIAKERTLVAGDAAAKLVDWLTRRGDLPGAAAAAILAGRAGHDDAPLRALIAKAFGHGSKRLADVPPAPPPLPARPSVEPGITAAKGEALLERAEEELARFIATNDPASESAKVPILPLFSALEPGALAELIGAFELRALARDEVAIRQGDEGREAFVVVRGTLRAVRATSDDEEETTLAILGPGAIFGEMALVSEAPRAASVIASESVELLVAARETLEAIAAKAPAVATQLGSFCRARMVANLMRHSAILGAVASEHREGLMSRFETRTFAAGETLLSEGQNAPGLFLLASGEVKVTSTDSDGDKVLLATLGPGEVVGEISLVLRRPATATVSAGTATVALHLSHDEFHAAIREHPTLLSELYDLATRREEETRSVVAQEALDVDDALLV